MDLKSKRDFPPYMMANSFGQQSFLLLPIWLTAVSIHFQTAPEDANWLGSAQLLGAALASIVVSLSLQRISWRRIACTGFSLSILGNLASAFAPSIEILAVCRLIAGFGEGSCLALSVGVAAGTKQPQKTFAVYTFGMALTSLLFMTVGPRLAEGFGPKGLFLLITLLPAIGFVFARRMPATPQEKGAGFKLPNFNLLIIAGITGLMIYNVGIASLWSFTAHIGVVTGLELSEVGTVLLFSTWFMLVAPFFAHRLGSRFGHRLPIILCLMASAVAANYMIQGGTEHAYRLSNFVLFFVVIFANPYILGTFALLDPSGRTNAISPLFSGIGQALGPFTAAFFVTGGKYDLLGFVFAGYMFAAMLLFSMAQPKD